MKTGKASRWVHWSAGCATALCLVRGGGVRAADTYYQVGPGQTYTTIQAALTAIPTNAFTGNNIVNVRAGTYNGQVSTDFNSKLNGKPSRTTKNNRLIIQAVPGEAVVVNYSATAGQPALLVRESHVTVQGIKFAGSAGTDPAAYYINLNDTRRGGLIVYNCEFAGARDVRDSRTTVTNVEPGVDFMCAVINNYVHDFESHYSLPGIYTNMQFYGGNLFVQWGSAGGASLFMPKNNSSTRKVYKDWFLNNTFYCTTPTLAGALRVDPPSSKVTWANNIVFINTANFTGAGYWGYANSNDTIKANNLQYGGQNWGKVNTLYRTLAAWTNALAARPGSVMEVNSRQGDPMFVNTNAASRDFRVAIKSPAYKAANTNYWNEAMNALGIAHLLGYWNSARDPGFQRGTPIHIGAMQNDPPHGTVVSVR